jgi:glycosyltransferase involved in cell wall biosynthesis
MAYRLGFVMEQTLGQVTHTLNFQRWVAQDPDVVATWIPVSFSEPDYWNTAPIVRNNWTLRASLRARRQVQLALRSSPLDGLFFHTQVTALFAQRLMTRIPTVVSMDATPLNFDDIGEPYAHKPSTYRPVEGIKNALNRRSFTRARKLVIWHEWGKRSLVEDYGIPAGKIEVIPPGIDLERWNFQRPATSPSGPVRLLFVGGDFRRKGGDTLLAAFRRDLMDHCQLDIVTRDPVNTEGLTNVRVHHGVGPNSPALMEMYARADVFLFPTLGDVLPLAIMEAMASGLPLVTTGVGALKEEVDDGVTGFIVSPADVDALAAATLRLVKSPELRRQMGAAARRTAELRYNGSRNYPGILALCKACVDQARA